MKKLVFVITVVFSVHLVYGQQRVPVKQELKNVSAKASMAIYGAQEFLPLNENFPEGLSQKIFWQEVIGNSQYDLQTNSSVDHRIRLYPDGTIGATFTMGTGTFADRGTGYNYFNGTSWGPIPNQRIENQRTGWPSYAPLGNGEVIFCHNYPVNSVLLKREVKGTGAWTETNIPNPTGATPTWPRIVTVGDTIHVLVNSYGAYQGMRQAVLYMRSTDGGQTFSDQIIDGMSSLNYASLGGDNYAWALPKNGVLAFVVGDKWTDLFLMKSLDGGNTWTKTVIFTHPIPHPMWQTPPIYADTTYVCDGSMAVELDNSGNAHVVFGIQRVLYDPAEDPTNEGLFSYFPGVDGVAYWKEGDLEFYSLDPDEVYANGKLVAWMLDVDNSGTVLDNFSSIDQFAKYYLSCSSMPQLTIDTNNEIYIVYSSINETLYSGTQFYRHVYSRKSTDGGNTWSDFSEITGGVFHEYSECVFPSTSKTSDNYLHILVQIDEEPGLCARGDEDVATNNEMTYFKILKTDIGVTSANIPETVVLSDCKVFPNPAQDNVFVSVHSQKYAVSVVTISNSLGQLVSSDNYTLVPGKNVISIPVEQYHPGLYIIRIESGNRILTNKFIVQ